MSSSNPPPTIPSSILHRKTTHIPHDSQVLVKLPSDKVKPVFLKSNSNSIPFDEKFRNRVSTKLPTVSGIAEKEYEKRLAEESKLREKEERRIQNQNQNQNQNGKGKGKQKQEEEAGTIATTNVDQEQKKEKEKETENGSASGEKKGKSKEVKTIASLGKFGSFDTSHVVGLPFGHTYEISDLDPKDPKALKVVVSGDLEELDETDANNQLINDTGSNPTITYTDIQELKRMGLNGREIIQKQMEMNQSFDLKTVYSKDKYAKRKESKYLKLFTPLAPTLAQISQHHFERNPERVRNLRPDSLSQILGLSNVRPGGRYLIIDSTGGVLAAGCLERMGGEGFLLALNDSDSPPAYDMISQMNFNHQVIDRVLSYLNWSMISKDWKPDDLPVDPETLSINQISTEGSSSSSSNKPTRKPKVIEREKQRFQKRKEAYDEIQDAREELFKGEFDGLIISSHYEPVSIIDRLLPYLAGSSNVLVHGPYLQPLIEAQARLRLRPECLSVTVTEPWLRRYQVLPGRTHPEMQTSATGGYILHFIRVLNDEEAQKLVDSREKQVVVENGGSGKKRSNEDGNSGDQNDVKKVKLEESISTDNGVE